MDEVRITRHAMYMDIAHVVAKRSTCMRLNVGAVVVKDRSIVSIGYNGSPPGQPHCDGETCLGSDGCRRTIHAEVNALSRVPDGMMDVDLYVTHSPCSSCYMNIWSSGQVGRVFFGAEFRQTDHLRDNLFELELYRVLPSGLVIDWSERKIVNVPS